MPAGYGDGNVAWILKDLFDNGFDGFLSLEPHLFNFAGFAELERDGLSMAHEDKKILSGYEAFCLAHDSLMRILQYIRDHKGPDFGHICAMENSLLLSK